mmetsp:Transcript_12250/g.23253  ORF Transcript_12250/g.23253 Transcript_12250/m.23253 type:complete len:113 (-) Transcript_12250:23-361(-)
MPEFRVSKISHHKRYRFKKARLDQPSPPPHKTPLSSPSEMLRKKNEKFLLHDPQLFSYIRAFEYEKKNAEHLAILHERELIDKYINSARISPKRRGVGLSFGLPRRPEPFNM